MAEMQKILEFVDSELRPDVSWSLKDEYPLVFSPHNKHHLFTVSDGELLQAHAALKIDVLSTPNGVFRYGALGSVVTAQASRSQGLGSALVRRVVDHAKGAADCDFLILWSNLDSFYSGLGFTPAGVEWNYTVDRDGLGRLGQMMGTIRPGERVSTDLRIPPEMLLRLYNYHTVKTVRSAQAISESLKIPKTRLWTLWDAGSQLKAYMVVGKGIDLHSHIHEWGGDVDSLMVLAKRAVEDRDGPLAWLIPHHSERLRAVLDQAHWPKQRGVLGYIQILKPQSFLKLLPGLTPAAALQPEVLFGDRTRDPLLPLWIWGWDSV